MSVVSAKRPDYVVNISNLKPGSVGRYRPVQGAVDTGGLRDRPWLAVHWKCCHAYNRVYRNAEGTMYEGACPKCGRRARARVGPEGVDARFFEAN